MKTANILHATIARDADCEKGTKGPWESRTVCCAACLRGNHSTSHTTARAALGSGSEVNSTSLNVAFHCNGFSWAAVGEK